MSKKSTKINKILENIPLPSKVCNQKTNKSSSKKSKMYEDMYDENSGVTELKLKDFKYNSKDKTLVCIHPLFTSLKRGIIIFYAPWCPHCNEMYDDIIELSLNYTNIFPIGVVNIEDIKNKNDELTVYANVTKYPTMKVLNKLMFLGDYNNDITKDNIVYYMNMNL